MKSIRGGALFVSLLGAAGATQAGVTSTWTAVSDYDLRGISQSSRDPAAQASLDYAHDSGFYASAWASNIDFGPGDPKLELDVYAGFARSLEGGLGYDIGAIYYTYPSENDLNYVEVYAGLGFTAASGASLKGKLYVSPDWGGETTPGSPTAEYLSLDGSLPLPRNFSVVAHAGYSFGDFWEDANSEYFDYALGVGYTTGKFSLALKYIGTDLSDVPHTNLFDSRDKVVFSIATTFPWGD